MSMSLKEIATYSGASYATVRRAKIQLGRMPTIEEMINRKGKIGRPTTVETQSQAATLNANKRLLKTCLVELSNKHGEDTTIKEIIEREFENANL